MLADDAEIQRAVAAAGWTFLRFGGRTLIVEGREFDVIRFLARKGGLVGQVTLLRGDAAANAFVQHIELHSRAVSAVRGTAALKIRVDVQDSECAMRMLKTLTAHPRPERFLGYAAAISQQGWMVDREHMREDDYDFTWTIPARRGEDELAFHVLFQGVTNKDHPVHIDDSGSARMIERGASWTLDVWVGADARELAEALLRR